MAAIRVFISQRGVMNHLSSAACEWFLMFLMFIDAALSYLVTKFAHYCELQRPCLFCLRLDHLFGNEKPGSYLSLFCSKHRAEISSLISCRIHDKLADAREMCEECFTPITMQNKPSSESYRFSVGKFGMDGFQRPYINTNFVHVPLSTGACSCCNRKWKAKSSVQRLIQPSAVGLGASKVTVKPPLPRVSGRSRFSRRDSFKRVRDKISGTMPPHHVGNTGVNALSYVAYTELRITSDSESEVPFSDDDDGSSAVLERSDSKENSVFQCGAESLDKAQSNNDSTPGKHAHHASDPGPSLLDQYVQLHEIKTNHAKSLTSDSLIGHGLGELNWAQLQAKPNPSTPPELIFQDDFPRSSDSNTSLSYMSNPSASSKQMPSGDILSQPKVPEVPLGVSSEKLSAVSAPSVSVVSAPSVYPSNIATNEGREVSSTLEEQPLMSDSLKVDKELKSLPLTLPTHEIDSLTYRSPRAFGHQDRSDASSSGGIRVLQGSASLHRNEEREREVSSTLAEQNVISVSLKVDKELKLLPLTLPAHEMDSSTYTSPRASLRRNDSSYESLDGSTVSEIEGESALERLKRQVEYDRKCMHSLHKELEEERSAAAVAANQAMAMITRLQEEKASLHMEALQYLRMMEEQAEYDMEALEKANDLVAEKEKEIQDLEAELESYRINYPDDLQVETNNLKEENMENGKNSVARVEANASSSSSLSSMKVLESSGKSIDVNTPLLDLEDEKLYISECLEKLERRLHQVSSLHTRNDMSNGVYSERTTNGVESNEELQTDGETQLDHMKEENSLSRHKDLSTPNGSPSTDDKSVVSIEENHFVSGERNHVDSHQKKSSIDGGVVDLATLENEISDLNDRLEALETDRDFLEHACNSLQNSEGLQFIQEIAHQLQELRKIVFERRCL